VPVGGGGQLPPFAPPRDDATGFEIKRVKVEVTRMHQDQIYRAFYCHMEIQKQFISYVPSVL